MAATRSPGFGYGRERLERRLFEGVRSWIESGQARREARDQRAADLLSGLRLVSLTLKQKSLHVKWTSTWTLESALNSAVRTIGCGEESSFRDGFDIAERDEALRQISAIRRGGLQAHRIARRRMIKANRRIAAAGPSDKNDRELAKILDEMRADLWRRLAESVAIRRLPSVEWKYADVHEAIENLYGSVTNAEKGDQNFK